MLIVESSSVTYISVTRYKEDNSSERNPHFCCLKHLSRREIFKTNQKPASHCISSKWPPVLLVWEKLFDRHCQRYNLIPIYMAIFRGRGSSVDRQRNVTNYYHYHNLPDILTINKKMWLTLVPMSQPYIQKQYKTAWNLFFFIYI